MGRVALITGASSGIGEALARRLAGDGWALGLVARRGDRLAALADELRAAGATVATQTADVTERAEQQQAIAVLSTELGGIDLLVANAGLSLPDEFDPLTVDDIERMVRVNLLGVIYSIEAVLPQMLERRSGHIAGVSSSGSYKGLPGSGGYCASKAGLNTFLEALRVQIRGSGVHVTTLCPGFVRTAMTDANAFRMPWLLEPEQAADLMVRAINRRRKVYNFP